ncbi:MAG: flap endonuclease-1 [Candidatus Aenigmatarchaeota archaeon]
MGVDLSNLAGPEETSLETFKGRTVALDALNMLYQFLSIIRQPDGEPLKDSKGRVTSHLSGVFYRTAKLEENEIRPFYVFDGEPPEFKESVNEKRRERRKEAKKKYEKALERGETEKAKKYAQQAVTVQEEMINQTKKLLDGMGIPWIQAPSEGEAQAAFMARRGEAWAVGSQDFDSLLFGAPILIRNLTITGKRKLPGKNTYREVRPEKIKLEETLEELGVNREQLIIIGILVGTDYTPGGVKGIGPKKALKLVKKQGNLRSVLERFDWPFDKDPEDIVNFFMEPPVNKDYELTWREPDTEDIKNFLCNEHDFSEDRIEKPIKRLKESRSGGKQSRLNSF